MIVASILVAAALARKPAPDVFILSAGEQFYRTGTKTRQVIAILEPGALAVKLPKGELRPYVAVRAAKDQPASAEVGIAFVLVRERR